MRIKRIKKGNEIKDTIFFIMVGSLSITRVRATAATFTVKYSELRDCQKLEIFSISYIGNNHIK